MHPRYTQKEIAKIWGDDHKLLLWQETEFAVLRARLKLGELGLTAEIVESIISKLRDTPLNLDEWHRLDNLFNHDLNAFLEERRQFLTPEEGVWFHKEMTSYDTEESAFATMLKQSTGEIEAQLEALVETLIPLALRYRYSPMNARTHGQEAELQTFGRRIVGYIATLKQAQRQLDFAKTFLELSKLSGAIGNYGGINPELEAEALLILNYVPFVGATQIMPRSFYLPLASAIFAVVSEVSNIALDLRLGARSGRPICQEPFSKTQRGSSMMPHKKNTITTEQAEGMRRLALGYWVQIAENLVTWEERAIEQSCVERVAWPDLFHTAINLLRKMTKVMSGLQVFPDNMLREIIDSRGCNASGEAKELLKKLGAPFGLFPDEAYQMVQLAAFNVFAPVEEDRELRANPPKSYQQAVLAGANLINRQAVEPVSIRDLIANACLRVSPELLADQEKVDRWNEILRQIFAGSEAAAEWVRIFSFEYLLRNEKFVFQAILGPEIDDLENI